jgi:hypothetical protein
MTSGSICHKALTRAEECSTVAKYSSTNREDVDKILFQNFGTLAPKHRRQIVRTQKIVHF